MKATFTVTVLLLERFEKAKEWKLEIPRSLDMIPQETSEFVYRISNSPPEFLNALEKGILAKHPRTGLRSVSVGDIIIIEEPESEKRHIASVLSCGFAFH
jgi:hypothetical protein